MPKSKGSSVEMVLHERHGHSRTVPPWPNSSQALRRAIATFQVDHGDSLISPKSLFSVWMPSAIYCSGQFFGCVYTHFSIPIPWLMSCSCQEVSDLSPDSAWADLQLCIRVMSPRGDPLPKTIHLKSVQLLLAERHQETFQRRSVTTFQEDIACALMGIFDIHLPATRGGNHSELEWFMQETVMTRSCDITALDCVANFSDLNRCLPEGIPFYNLPSIFSSSSEDEMQELDDCHDFKFSLQHRLRVTKIWIIIFFTSPIICRKRMHSRTLEQFLRRAERYRARYQPNSCRYRIHSNTRHYPPAQKPEACPISLYITPKITHHEVCSPHVYPPADARSVK